MELIFYLLTFVWFLVYIVCKEYQIGCLRKIIKLKSDINIEQDEMISLYKKQIKLFQGNSDEKVCFTCKNKIVDVLHGSTFNGIHFLFCSKACKEQFLLDQENMESEENDSSPVYSCNFCGGVFKFPRQPFQKNGEEYCSEECSVREGLSDKDKTDVMLGKTSYKDYI